MPQDMTFDPSLAVIRCPKGCQIATAPEPADRPSRYACVACGHEFTFTASAPLAGNAERESPQASRRRRS